VTGFSRSKGCSYFHIIRNDPSIFHGADLSGGLSSPAYFEKAILADEKTSCFSGVADFVGDTGLDPTNST